MKIENASRVPSGEIRGRSTSQLKDLDEVRAVGVDGEQRIDDLAGTVVDRLDLAEDDPACRVRDASWILSAASTHGGLRSCRPGSAKTPGPVNPTRRYGRSEAAWFPMEAPTGAIVSGRCHAPRREAHRAKRTPGSYDEVSGIPRRIAALTSPGP